jgi:hypothetical protein
MVGKACGDAKVNAASAADPPPGGRFPAHSLMRRFMSLLGLN